METNFTSFTSIFFLLGGAGDGSTSELLKINKDIKTIMTKVLKASTSQTKFIQKFMEVQAKLIEDIVDKDNYDKISANSRSRKLEKSVYTTEYNVPLHDLPCMVTGITINSLKAANPNSPPPNNTVTMAHLVGHCVEAKEAVSLGYFSEELKSIRNTVLLCKGIEEAFGRKFLSFVPADSPFAADKYKLKIWVDGIKPKPIYPGSTINIGAYDGAPLNLTIGGSTHNPFHRALSYQAYRAFKMWGTEYGHTLPEDCDISIYSGSYKATREKYALQLAKDIAADQEDEEYEKDEEDEDTEEIIVLKSEIIS